MGWNTAALFLAGAGADQAVAALGPADPTPEVVGADEATGGMRHDVLFAAASGGWAQAWNPAMDRVLAWQPAGWTAPALTVMFSSVSSTYGFSLYRDGGLARQYVHSDGETVVDEGAPLPVEASVTLPSWGPDEDFVWAVIQAVTGVTYDDHLQYRVHALR